MKLIVKCTQLSLPALRCYRYQVPTLATKEMPRFRYGFIQQCFRWFLKYR